MFVTRWWAATALLSLSVWMSGCGGPQTQTDDPSREPGNKAQCRAVRERALPFVADWPQKQQDFLVQRMNSGVVVVAYTCDRLEVLPNCTVEGAYGYLGQNAATELIQFESGDELQANMPARAGELGGKLSGGETWDLALVYSGKRRTAVREVTRSELSGNCTGATHFVRTAYLGGFAMARGKRGEAPGATALFKSAPAEQKRGELKSCYSVGPDSAEPQENCSAALRLELRSIGEIDKDRDEARAIEGGDCPSGTVMTAGKCVLKSGAYTCNPEDAAECEAQCSAGNAESCGNLGFLHFYGLRGAKHDHKRAAELFRRACDRGAHLGCWGQAYMHEYGLGGLAKDYTMSAELHQKACDAGEGRACHRLGVAYEVGRGVPKSTPQATHFYAKGCHGGDPQACASKGYFEEKNGSYPVMIQYYEMGCAGGSPLGCNNLGWAYQKGFGVPKDPMQAVKLYERACTKLGHKLDESHGAGLACTNIGIMYEEGVPGVVDGRRALAYYEQACTHGAGWGCHNALVFAAWGKLGVSPNPTLAAKVGKRGCYESKHGPSCLRFGEWHQGAGRPSEAKQAYQTGCASGDSECCSKASQL